jgi:glycosyltransferase involved in cell wall biosynthesis
MSEPLRPLSLSVVVPCFNAAATLGEQLQAISRQRWEGPWEVIVADNGSTDGSAAVAEGCRERLPALRVERAGGRKGPGHSRNVGAAAATGEALVFCDADDVVGEGWLAAMGRALSRHDFVAARYDATRLNPPWLVEARGMHQHEGLNPYTYPPFLPHAGAGGLGVKRRLHQEIGGFDASLPALEDTDYCWRLQLAGHPLYFVADAVVHVRYRQDLGGIFRQTCRLGVCNVLMYRRYRPRGMPRLPLSWGLGRWAKLLATAPLLLSPRRRWRWIHQASWRLGRLAGCLRYRVLAL